MLFNSLDFAIFLPIVFAVYWLINSWGVKIQNVYILLVSYLFYGWWDWRFLILIAISSGVDYGVGLALANHKDPRKRKALMGLSLLINLGMLGFFKYFNFFSENFAAAFTLLGKPMDPVTLDWVLPVGISFYTFQTLSYTIDIYRNRIQPTRDIVTFFAFVSFFPQLVAGPIERARNLLPQFDKPRTFQKEQVIDGLRQILWGLISKIVIADNCAGYIQRMYEAPGEVSGSSLLLAAVLFAVQIYGDFSGYSHIAIGTARLLNFDLTRNFAYPLFSTNMSELWARWHISLTTWIRDYVYFPLRKTPLGRILKAKTVFLSFALMGFWHGPEWNFIIWGVLNAGLLLLLNGRIERYENGRAALLPKPIPFLRMLVTFMIIALTTIFFRVTDFWMVIEIFKQIFSASLFEPMTPFDPKRGFLIIAFFIAEWVNRSKPHTLDFSTSRIPQLIRWLIYYYLIYQVIWWGMVQPQEAFIYFQF